MRSLRPPAGGQPGSWVVAGFAVPLVPPARCVSGRSRCERVAAGGGRRRPGYPLGRRKLATGSAQGHRPGPHGVPATPTWWELRGTLPPLSGRRHLVLRQNFSPGWRLAVGANAPQGAERAHGIFNGWEVGPSSRTQTFAIFFGLQRLDAVANVLGNLPLLACCLWLVYAGLTALMSQPTLPPPGLDHT